MRILETTGRSGQYQTLLGPPPGSRFIRWIAWSLCGLTLAFLVNNALTFWMDFPGVWPLLHHYGLLGEVKALEGQALELSRYQMLGYAASFLVPLPFVVRTIGRTLRHDAIAIANLTNFVIKVAFWSILLIGLVDMTISFLRVEGMLADVVGASLETELGRSKFRGPYVHVPLIGVAVLFAIFFRTLGFHWLALLVVLAELSIVLSRFVFSYEQAFQGDLVRFWYAGLFLFASAYTLFEDGHVRVDVLYAGFSRPARGRVNTIGAILLGMSLCWVVLLVGMWDKTSILNSPLLTFEVSQSGFGMYVKYWMATFLSVFAVSMNLQFTSSLLEGIADWRGEPGARQMPEAGGH